MKFKCANSGSDGNSYALIADNGEILLLDAGLSIKWIKQLIDFRIADISAVLITHEHLDHALSADAFEKMGIKVIRAYKDRGITNHVCGGFDVIPFDLPHDGIDNRGYFIRFQNHKILYLTDFEFCKYHFKAHQPDTIIVECNYQTELVEMESENVFHVFHGHASLDTCKNFILANQTDNLRNVILCHMSERNADPLECVNQIQSAVGDKVNVTVATRGCSIGI